MQPGRKILVFIANRAGAAAQALHSGFLFGVSGLLQQQLGSKAMAAESFRLANHYSPKNLFWLRCHIQSLPRIWQQLESFASHQNNFSTKHRYWLKLGELQLGMARLDEAKTSIERALQIKKTARAYWLQGYIQSLQNNTEASAQAYSLAEKCSWNLWVKRYGIGHWFTQAGAWPQAQAAYAQRLALQPGLTRTHKARLLVRTAYAEQRLQNWAEAQHAYQQALQLDFRPGLLEPLFWACIQNNNWPEAEKICSQALKLTGRGIQRHKKNLHKWRAIAQSQFAPEDSAKSFFEFYGSIGQLQPAEHLKPDNPALQHHAKRTHGFLHLATTHWQAGNWKSAADSLHNALRGWPEHSAYLYRALAEAQFRQNLYKEACQTYKQADLFFLPACASQHAREKNQGVRRTLEYLEFRETLPVESHCILYESYQGASIGCNPYAIFQRLIDTQAFYGHLHVWVLNDVTQLPPGWLERPNVVLVARDSTAYQRYLATAKWIIGNNTLRPHFIRRPQQRYLNTWHGTPLKTLGKDIKGFMEHKGAASSFLQATHLLLPNRHTEQVLIDRHDLRGVYSGSLLATGAPRNDFLLSASNEDKEHIRQQLGIQKESGPVILYAPTWRGSAAGPDSSLDLVRRVVSTLKQHNCTVLFRGHHMVEQQILAAGLEDIHIAPQAMDVSRVLAVTDILLTDYSSILFDFLITSRPLVLYTEDSEEYKNKRGLYFDLNEMPGVKCHNTAQLDSTIGQLIHQHQLNKWQPGADYLEAQQRFCPHEDGQATDRVIKRFFKETDNENPQKDNQRKKSLLFFAGSFPGNGITTAFINLLQHIDPAHYRIVVVLDHAAMSKQADAITRLKQLPQHVQIIARAGRQLLSGAERAASANLNRFHTLSTPAQNYLQTSSKREFQRMFGAWQPDAVIHYEGYSCNWASILGLGSPTASKRLVYLHNDMQREWHNKFPYLQTMFGLYENFAALVSVSAAISEVNRNNLAKPFALEAGKFVHAANLTCFADILKKSAEPAPAELRDWFVEAPDGQRFISLGRLSPEKNHRLLLDAFKHVLKTCPQARLLILGEGALRDALEQQLLALGIKHAVCMPGAYSNPFPILALSDCLVLPSLYEGLGMVLLEAMALEKNIIATDIPPVRELLTAAYGTLTEATPQALAAAMQDITKTAGTSDTQAQFASQQYSEQALEQFYALLN